MCFVDNIGTIFLGNEINLETILPSVFVVRGAKAMIDADLAKSYGFETKRLNERVKRNSKRSPEDFMFQLTKEEFKILKSQNATSSWGGRITMPYAFTEHGIAMLSRAGPYFRSGARSIKSNRHYLG